MVFEALERLGSKAERVLMYPEEWKGKMAKRDRELLVTAQNWYKVKLEPVKTIDLHGETGGGLDNESGVKGLSGLLTLSQGQYERVLHLDSDITLFKHLDDFFLLPRAQVAATRAYWTDQTILSPTLILLEPSELESKRVQSALKANALLKNTTSFDSNIFSTLYTSSALLLPHRSYALQTHEFRRPGPLNHTSFLGNTYEKWDADRILREASLVRFFDSPLPKPWVMWPNNLLLETRPKCDVDPGTENESGCRNREVWMDLYNDFRRRRKDVCKLLSVPAPEWPPREPLARQEAKARVDDLKTVVKDPEEAGDTSLDRIKTLQAQMKASVEAATAGKTGEKTASGVSKELADKARAEMRKSYSGATEEKAAEVNRVGSLPVVRDIGDTKAAVDSKPLGAAAGEKKAPTGPIVENEKETTRYEKTLPAIRVNGKGELVNEAGDTKEMAARKQKARGAMRKAYSGTTADKIGEILGG
ncbi:MAG: N-acetylglucosaminyltransferase [Icmadophila ericetorum]|nr:N-acetylglucosaminyltransferase [Icmadophila ericetorum]